MLGSITARASAGFLCAALVFSTPPPSAEASIIARVDTCYDQVLGWTAKGAVVVHRLCVSGSSYRSWSSRSGRRPRRLRKSRTVSIFTLSPWTSRRRSICSGAPSARCPVSLKAARRLRKVRRLRLKSSKKSILGAPKIVVKRSGGSFRVSLSKAGRNLTLGATTAPRLYGVTASKLRYSHRLQWKPNGSAVVISFTVAYSSRLRSVSRTWVKPFRIRTKP